MQKARFYNKEDGNIHCLLCPRRCSLAEGQTGVCGSRRVREGELWAESYGRCTARHWDPVEKKPLYHFCPGLPILSLGSYGCNLLCSFCQNWHIARDKTGENCSYLNPAEVLEELGNKGGPDRVAGVAFTYNEPTAWYEFIYDTARLVKESGYRSVLVTNGFINPEALEEILPFIDAFNIDIKAFSNDFYDRYCGGARNPVLKTVERAVAASHVEITTLLIPTLNDSSQEIQELAAWLAEINPSIPLHFSRYFPRYKVDLPPTPVETLLRAREIAEKKLGYVYLGNIELPGTADTYCTRCGSLLIERRGFSPRITGLEGKQCSRCGETINIVLAKT